MKMHYSRNVKAQMHHRKPRKKIMIKKSTIDEFIIFNLWFYLYFVNWFHDVRKWPAKAGLFFTQKSKIEKRVLLPVFHRIQARLRNYNAYAKNKTNF